MKLYYFNAAGRGEIIRWLMELGGVVYEDVRIPFDKWPEVKPTTPTGQMPYIEDNGFYLFDSHVIARYIAKKTGFAGKTPQEEAKADSVVALVADMMAKMAQIFAVKNDEEKKAPLVKKWADEEFDFFMKNFEKQLSASGYFLKELSWADVVFTQIFEFMDVLKLPNALTAYPKLKALKSKVEAHPKIAAWKKKRPST